MLKKRHPQPELKEALLEMQQLKNEVGCVIEEKKDQYDACYAQIFKESTKQFRLGWVKRQQLFYYRVVADPDVYYRLVFLLFFLFGGLSSFCFEWLLLFGVSFCVFHLGLFPSLLSSSSISFLQFVLSDTKPEKNLLWVHKSIPSSFSVLSLCTFFPLCFPILSHRASCHLQSHSLLTNAAQNPN